MTRPQNGLRGLRGCDSTGDADRTTELPVFRRGFGENAFSPFPGLHDPLAGFIATGGDVDEVDQIEAGAGDDPEGGRRVQALFGALERRDPYADRGRAGRVADRHQDLVEEADRIPVFITPLVGPRHHELVDQIAVRRMEAENIYTSPNRSHRGAGEILDEVLDATRVELSGNVAAGDLTRNC